MLRINFAVVIALSLLFGLSSTAQGAKYSFIGSKACERCHVEIYKSWKNSMHAKVFNLLKPNVRINEKKEAGLDPKTDFSKDKSCMKCHVTGWEKGGYSFENPDDEWKGIGCEDCHGAAEKWMLLHTNKNLKKRDRKLKQAGFIKPFRGKNVCMKCHYNLSNPYKYRDPNQEIDWTDPKYADTYHISK